MDACVQRSRQNLLWRRRLPNGGQLPPPVSEPGTRAAAVSSPEPSPNPKPYYLGFMLKHRHSRGVSGPPSRRSSRAGRDLLGPQGLAGMFLATGHVFQGTRCWQVFCPRLDGLRIEIRVHATERDRPVLGGVFVVLLLDSRVFLIGNVTDRKPRVGRGPCSLNPFATANLRPCTRRRAQDHGIRPSEHALASQKDSEVCRSAEARNTERKKNRGEGGEKGTEFARKCGSNSPVSPTRTLCFCPRVLSIRLSSPVTASCDTIAVGERTAARAREIIATQSCWRYPLLVNAGVADEPTTAGASASAKRKKGRERWKVQPLVVKQSPGSGCAAPVRRGFIVCPAVCRHWRAVFALNDSRNRAPIALRSLHPGPGPGPA